MRDFITIIRAHPLAGDTRVQRLVSTCLSEGLRVRVLYWDREHAALTATGDLLAVDARSYGRRGMYGRGLRNLLPMMGWNGWLLRQLMFRHGDREILYACDLDCVMPALVYRLGALFSRRRRLVYDVFDCFADSRLEHHHVLQLLARKFERWIARRADALVVPAANRLSQLGLPVTYPATVIYNSPRWSEAIMPRHAPPLRAGFARVVFVGLLTPGRFIEHALRIAQANAWIEFHFAGYGSIAEMVRAAATSLPNVKYHGTITYESARALQESATALFAVYDPAIPNHRYSSPNKFFEAGYLGLPIIVARETGVDRLVDEDSVGAVIDYGDESAFVREVGKFARWTDLQRQAFSEKARQVFTRKYSWNQMECRYHDMLEKLW